MINPYQFPVTCNVCGGEGVATGKTVGDTYRGGEIRHKDLSVCAAILKQKKEHLDKKEKSLNS